MVMQSLGDCLAGAPIIITDGNSRRQRLLSSSAVISNSQTYWKNHLTFATACSAGGN